MTGAEERLKPFVGDGGVGAAISMLNACALLHAAHAARTACTAPPGSCELYVYDAWLVRLLADVCSDAEKHLSANLLVLAGEHLRGHMSRVLEHARGLDAASAAQEKKDAEGEAE